MSCDPLIVWIRNDLRITNNPALFKATQEKVPCFVIFIDDNTLSPPLSLGSASKVWLHNSLQKFQKQLEELGTTLHLFQGTPLEIINKVITHTGIKRICWNRRYEPHLLEIDRAIEKSLTDMDIEVTTYKGNILIEPWNIANKQGKPFQVYTPFLKAVQTLGIKNTPNQKITSLQDFGRAHIHNLPLEKLALLPKHNWTHEIVRNWSCGEIAAQKKLDVFINKSLNTYDIDRDFPAHDGTSKLSAHIHFGELSIEEIWHKVLNMKLEQKASSNGIDVYLKELIWREFAHHLLYHFPHTYREPLREEFLQFPWNDDPHLLTLWQKGKTGYPIVDAGMRQLWKTGWMHNRVRMIVASFLVKHLMLPWQQGASWFWDTLVDADLANNTLGWQWSAGCGADAAPYFRIFNPTLQSKKFDPEGEYIKTWVPELRHLSPQYIHTPWEVSAQELKRAHLELPHDYPLPCVNHEEARKRALQAFASMQGKSII